MQPLEFKQSKLGTIGVELELQIIDLQTYKLAPFAKQILDHFEQTDLKDRINHEITQGMIEINTSPHETPEALYEELKQIQTQLLTFAEGKQFGFCGGGTHPFQDWHEQEIFPDPRYKRVLQEFKFLCQQATIFGQHVHFGCESAEESIYLTHALSQYIPMFISLSASSPFFQSIDSGFCSSRNTQFNAFPFSGHIPYLKDWRAFTEYFLYLKNLGLIESMKDIYWDIRPKPEFGTVEVRVLDTPLTLKKAAAIAAFIQALSLYLIDERPIQISPEMYYLYRCDRFQASRHGLSGHCTNPRVCNQEGIQNDILNLLKTVQPYSRSGTDTPLLGELEGYVSKAKCDASLIRDYYKKNQSLEEVVMNQCHAWTDNKASML